MTNGLLNNLVGYWGLDEASGANDALDKHTGARTLTHAASPGSSTGKVYSGARTFNGSTQYFNRASETALQGGDNDITISAWVYLTANSSEQIIVTKAASTEEYYLYYASSSNRFAFSVNDGAGHYTAVTANTFGAPSLNTWYFVTGVHDAVNNQIKISVNNGTFDTASHTYGIASTSDNFCVGAIYTGSTVISPLTGRIGPVAMWKSAPGSGGALTSTQVGQLYNSGNGLAYHAFDDATGHPAIVPGYTVASRTSNGTTLACNVPLYVAGDTIYYFWASDGDADSASISGTGWTAVYTDVTLASSGVADSGSFYVWKRTAGSEPSSYTVTSGVSERSVIVAFAVRNDGGINISATNNSGTNSTAVVNSLTTTVDNCLRISAVVATGEKTVTTLSGHTLLVTQSATSAATISVQYKALPTAGSDGSVNATTGSNYWHTFAFAIAPAVNTVSVTPDNITTSAPSVASVAITQNHSITSSAITTSASQVQDTNLTQKHALTATGITTAAPSIPTFLLGLGFGVPDLYTGAPSVATAALTQNHSLAATAITTSAPPAAVATLSLLQALTATAITTGSPTVDNAKLNDFAFFVSATTASSATGQTTATIPVPTYAVDDVLLVYLAVENDNATITPDQSGWTLLWKSYLTGRAHTQAAYWRRAGGSEPSNYTWTITSGEWVGTMLSYRNASAPYGYAASWNDTTSTSLPSPDITTTSNYDLVIANGSTAYGVTFTPPTNFTERVDVRSASTSTSVALYVADYLVPSATTLTGISATQTNADYSTGGIVAFPKKPATQALTATGITTGSPTVALISLNFNYSLASPGFTTAQPSVDTAPFSESQVLPVNGITTGNPEVGQLTLTLILGLVAIAPSIGPPTLGSPSILQNHALTSSAISTGTPELGTLQIVEGNVITPVSITCANPVNDNATLVQNIAISVLDIETGTPTVAQPNITQEHSILANNITTDTPSIETTTITKGHPLICNGITTGAVNIATPALSQSQVIAVNGITTDNPVVDQLAMNGATALVPVGILIGQPAVAAASLTQKHSLAGSALTTGSPTLGTSQLHQEHALACANMTAGSPTVNDAALSQAQVLSAVSIVTAAPVVSQASFTRNVVLGANGIFAEQPDVPPADIFQNHTLAAIAITTGAITLGQPTITVTSGMAAVGITTGAPTLDSAVCSIRSNLVPSGITVGSYFLPNPELVQIVNFAPNGITTGQPVVANLQVGVGSEMLPENITTGNPVVGTAQVLIQHLLVPQGITTGASIVAQILLLQHHNLIASTITTNGPSVGTLPLNAGDRDPGRHTFTTKREKDAYDVRTYQKVYSVRVFRRTHNT
jgi:hypothetical protein